MREEGGHVETDAARADDGHAVAGLSTARQQVGIS